MKFGLPYFIHLIPLLLFNYHTFSQVDTAFVFNPKTPFGPMDIRLSKGSGHSYYLEENKTFSFRENNEGRTNAYLTMTAWDSSPYGEGNLREKNDNTDLFVMNYRMLVPQNYDTKFAEGYPLVIVMHGFLERGNCAERDCYHADKSYSPNKNSPPAPAAADHELLNNDYSLVHTGSNYLEAHKINGARLPDDPALPSKGFPGFVVFPQNLNGWDQTASEDVIRLVRLLSKKYNINENRIYINGISHGGHGAYEVIKRAPWMFAAAVMFSAADDASVINQKMSGAIAHIPIWIFQGALDANPSKSKTENYINAFRKAGAKVRYTLYPQLAHGTWNKAIDEPDFFSWMLAQDRTNIHIPGDNPAICKTSTSGTLLTLPNGFPAYEWERNGVIIPNANSNNYSAFEPGVYRARFMLAGFNAEAQWSDWSDTLSLKEQHPEAAQIKQTGTLLLPDLNGNPDAHLEAVGNFVYHYWYKDDVLLNSADKKYDTLKEVTLTPTSGNGSYSLSVAGFSNCKSLESISKQIIFNDEAPVNVASPFDFKAEITSPSEIHLTWSDTAHNENGFEIWRKKLALDPSFSPWEMATITVANTTSFTDQNLSPSSTYHYKIRAINDSERSHYTPEGVNDLVATTSADTELPSAPRDLSASPAGVKSIRLNWMPSLDNSSIREYIVFYNEDSIRTSSTDTTYLINELNINTVYSFEVSAVDQGENLSPASNQAQGSTFLSGLYYEHSTGAWDNLNAIDWSIAEFSGIVSDFTLALKTQEDFFNFMFDGFLSIEKEGVYQFRLTSDDGSRLSLNDSLLIENDGIHNINTVTSPIQLLNAGAQRITVKYFDYVKVDTLLIEYKGPDSNNEWVKVPSEALTSNIITSTESIENKEFDFTIYPNPTTRNNINIKLQSRSYGPVLILIMDPAGRQLYKGVSDFKDTIQVTPSHYIENGMYIISIRQDTFMINKKIIIR